MKSVKATFDGERIVLPEHLEDLEVGTEVILVYGVGAEISWLQAQERSLARVWDNEQDQDYDAL